MCLASCIWHSSMPSCVTGFLPFCCSIFCVNIPNMCIHTSADRLLGYLQFGAVADAAALDMVACSFWCTCAHVLLGRIPRARTAACEHENVQQQWIMPLVFWSGCPSVYFHQQYMTTCLLPFRRESFLVCLVYLTQEVHTCGYCKSRVGLWPNFLQMVSVVCSVNALALDSDKPEFKPCLCHLFAVLHYAKHLTS